ncbi:MAG TPA: cysteine desulfurase family protein [Candidatus Xenobia bacterium]|jgi:cysteine desulfurase
MSIYLDYNATTPLDPQVLDAMMPYLTERYGNASSGHWAGKLARAGIDRAREQVAAMLGCDAEEIVFTGGASEANNMCLKGAAWEQRGLPPRRLLTSVVEHASVANACDFLQRREEYVVHKLPVDPYGMVRLDEARLTSDTTLVSLMRAQNEVGTLQPVQSLVEMVREKCPNALVHTDACQAGGKIPVNVKDLGVDMCVIAAHKFYGPKGTAAAYIRKGLKLESLVHGVAHESGRRAGTENVAGIVGMGAACELAVSRMEAVTSHLVALRERLWERLQAAFPGAVRNGHPTEILPNTLNVCLRNIDTTSLLAAVGADLALSNGAACHWGITKPSAVLSAMGVHPEHAMGAIRFSLGKNTSESDVDEAVRLLKDRAQEYTPGSVVFSQGGPETSQ